MIPPLASTTTGWEVREVETLAETEHLVLDRAVFSSPLCPEGKPWLVVRRKSAVVIVPQRADGKFLFIRQERPPVCQLLWEFPAGQVEEAVPEGVDADGRQEILHRAALRELEEETGHTTRHALEYLGTYYSSPGFTNERETIFLAREVKPLPNVSRLGEHSEAIAGVEFLSPEEVLAAIRSGEIMDANSLAAWTFLGCRGYLAD
jgi:ADP-ribose pyrophosphatase